MTELRSAEPGDAAALSELDRKAFGRDAWSQRQVADELTGAGRIAVVAAPEVGRAGPVGFVLCRVADEVADVLRLVVADSHRRVGVATRLLARVAELAREAGAHRMLLEVSARNERAVRFYAARGFAQIDRRRGYYRDGADAIVMTAPTALPHPGSGCGRATGQGR